MSAYVKSSIAVGFVLLGIGLAVHFLSDPTPQTFWIVRVVISLGVGFLAAGILGTLSIEDPRVNLGVKAAGPIALTVLVYLANPPSVAQQLIGP